MSKGRRLTAPRGQGVRPTSGRVKETIFDILGGEVTEKAVLDLFAGTGSLGIEALSRGARSALFVEKGRQAVKLIRMNLARCGMEGRSEVLMNDVNRAIGFLKGKGETFDLVLMDPPYGKGWVERTLRKLQSERIYHEDSILIIQRDRREPLSNIGNQWTLIRERKIGDTVVSFLTPGRINTRPVESSPWS
jgi:16S rRNA (guanine966-N2)-methyltransferase